MKEWKEQSKLLVRGFRTWGFPKNRGTFLGVPIIRTMVYWGSYWGPLILGNYHLEQGMEQTL